VLAPPPDYADLFSRERELDTAPVPPVPFQESDLPTVQAYRVSHPSPAPAPAVAPDMTQLQNENSTLKSQLGECSTNLDRCLQHADRYFREKEKGKDKKTKEGKARVRTKYWVVLKYVDSYRGQNAPTGEGRLRERDVGSLEAVNIAKNVVTSQDYGGFVRCAGGPRRRIHRKLAVSGSIFFRSASQDELIDDAAYHIGGCVPELYLAPGASIEKLRAFYETNKNIHLDPPPEAEARGQGPPFTIEGDDSDLEWISPSLVKRGGIRLKNKQTKRKSRRKNRKRKSRKRIKRKSRGKIKRKSRRKRRKSRRKSRRSKSYKP